MFFCAFSLYSFDVINIVIAKQTNIIGIVISVVETALVNPNIAKATVIVTHAGSGALFSSIKSGKKVIAVARLCKYGEMVDDHQTELTRKLAEEGYILDGTNSIIDAWKKIEGFVPRKNDFVCTIPEVLESIIFMKPCFRFWQCLYLW